MSAGAAGGAAGAAAAAVAVSEAIKASGAIVRVAPAEFQKLMNQNPRGLVVHAVGGLFSRRHKYLMGYQGLVFQASAPEAIPVPGTCQIVEANKIWIPG
ncbi:MAG: hypothetical protein ACRENJ_07370 [Candidatus Eiseniibacteriota bacterium]